MAAARPAHDPKVIPGSPPAGHDVVVAAPAMFADLIGGCGLEFRPLELNLSVEADLADINPLKVMTAFYAPSGVRAIGEGMLTALRDESADVLLLSPLVEFAGHPLAEAKAIPAIGVRLQPLSATAAYPPAVLGMVTRLGWQPSVRLPSRSARSRRARPRLRRR
jgi:sterol 3beta-glucosyltransferase